MAVKVSKTKDQGRRNEMKWRGIGVIRGRGESRGRDTTEV
jgi:hypothetical protein